MGFLSLINIIPMKQFGRDPFHLPCPLQYNTFAPTRKYPFLQRKWYTLPSTDPEPIIKPFNNDDRSAGHSANKIKGAIVLILNEMKVIAFNYENRGWLLGCSAKRKNCIFSYLNMSTS